MPWLYMRVLSDSVAVLVCAVYSVYDPVWILHMHIVVCTHVPWNPTGHARLSCARSRNERVTCAAPVLACMRPETTTVVMNDHFLNNRVREEGGGRVGTRHRHDMHTLQRTKNVLRRTYEDATEARHLCVRRLQP